MEVLSELQVVPTKVHLMSHLSVENASTCLVAGMPGVEHLCIKIVLAEIPHFLYERETLCQRASTVPGLIPSLLRSLYLSLRLANHISLSSADSVALAPFFFEAFLACICYLQ